MFTRVFQLCCDENSPQCDCIGYFDSLFTAKACGWIISSDNSRCYCPSCSCTVSREEDNIDG